MPGKPRLLNLDRITVTAFEVFEEKGLDAFSLRQLATRLDVHVSALYRHFKNKETLLLHLATTMLNDYPYESPGRKTSWQKWLTSDATSLRKALLTHRDGPQLFMAYHQHIDSPHSRTLFKILSSNGFTDRDAAYYVSTVVNYVIGFALEESYRNRAQKSTQVMAGSISAIPSKAFSPKQSANIEFEYGLKILIAGIESTTPLG